MVKSVLLQLQWHTIGTRGEEADMYAICNVYKMLPALVL